MIILFLHKKENQHYLFILQILFIRTQLCNQSKLGGLCIYPE
jgi:hypothetical protein